MMPGVSLIVATEGTVELHPPLGVRSWVVPSLKVPVAVNCRAVPSGIDAVAGLIAIETRLALVTVNVVDPVTGPEAALMVVDPGAMLEANPVLLIVAVAAVLEDHVAVLVKFCVLPSL